MLRIRAALESDLLAIDVVDFVSVAFSRENASTVMVTIGTQRPDLVTALLQTHIIPALARHLHDQPMLENPEIQILRGSSKQRAG